MSRPPVTIGEDRFVGEAFRILSSRGFRHLPVVDGEGRLTGILSDRDRRSTGPSELLPDQEREALLERLEKTPVRDIMTGGPQHLTLSSTLDDALFVFERDGIGALPVTDGEGRVAGVFSVQDLMRAFREVFGLGAAGSSLVEIEDDGSQDFTTRVARVLDERKVQVFRMIRVTEEGGRPPLLYLRANTYNLHSLHEAFGRCGLKIRLDRPEDDDAKG
jgi:acetoin utilization protein AcuB